MRSDGDREGAAYKGESEWGVLIDISFVQVYPGAQPATQLATCYTTDAAMVSDMDPTGLHFPNTAD
eukprot:14101384-Ditylum_brightwellii.AAC.1